MLTHFHCEGVTFEKHSKEACLVVAGEISNRSTKSYQAVVFRLHIYIKGRTAINVPVTINGFNSGQIRRFEKEIKELEYDKVISVISNYEIYAESAY